MSCTTQFHNRVSLLKKEKVNMPVIDAHLHMVDFIQETDGAKKLIHIMNKSNIEKAIVFGLAVRKKWDYIDSEAPHYYLDNNAKCYYFSGTDEIVAEEFQKLSNKEQKRIAPCIVGFNPTDKYSVKYIESLLNKYPFWKGVGEILLRHDDLTNLTLDETPRINHPAMFPVYELCASRKLPIIIHQNSSSVGIHNKFEYLHEVEEVLKNFPKTNFVWAHCGISRRIFHKQYTRMINKLLSNYNNLYADISWVIFDDIICKEEHCPKQEWINIIKKHSDRFFIGSDLTGHFNALGKTLARYNTLFEKLPQDISKKIAFTNANNLWFQEKNS